MSAFHFRFNRANPFGAGPFGASPFKARAFRAGFTSRKPRNPVVRVVLGLVGLGLLAVLVFFSVFVGAAMLAVGLLYRLWTRHSRPLARNADAHVVDGEFEIVDKPIVDKPALPSA